MTKTLLLLAGDGIGPEVTAQSQRVAERLIESSGLDLKVENALFGGASIDATGVPIEAQTIARAQAADAVLMGAVGGPKWASAEYHLRPEAGLLQLRRTMNVFANLRPCVCFPALADASSLKRELVENLDLVFVRELVGGIYFNTPRGIEELGNGNRRGFNTQSYTSTEVVRVARVAFELARLRRRKVCSVDKSNVLESGVLWREEVSKLQAAEYQDVELIHMYADNCAMQLVRCPTQFDVVLTDNLFGDILSDAAAMLTGSLGMLPSAAIGEHNTSGLYEPIHGSAPDIAGQGTANPCASILSLAMALRFSLGRPDLADRVEKAVALALDDGYRTRDLGGGKFRVGTVEMGNAIRARL